MGMGFQFEQHRLGLWDLSWDLKKNNFLGNGIRTPPSRPSKRTKNHTLWGCTPAKAVALC